MSIGEQGASNNEALLSREEINRQNPAFEHDASEFYSARVYERSRSAGYGLRDYWDAVHIEGHGMSMDLDGQEASTDEDDAMDLRFIHQMAKPDTLSVAPLSESNDTQLTLASQRKTESILDDFTVTYTSIAAYEVEPQDEVTELHAHIIGLRGLIRTNASREIKAIGSLLNSSIANLQYTKPWVVARHNTLAYGHTIAAQLLEFEVTEGGAKTSLRPVVMTADHQRGYLPTDYQLVDDWLYFENSGDGEVA